MSKARYPADTGGNRKTPGRRTRPPGDGRPSRPPGDPALPDLRAPIATDEATGHRTVRESRRSSGRRHRSRGQALVELALVTPLLLLLFAAAADLGRVFYAYVAVEHAAKEGAMFG